MKSTGHNRQGIHYQHAHPDKHIIVCPAGGNWVPVQVKLDDGGFLVLDRDAHFFHMARTSATAIRACNLVSQR